MKFYFVRHGRASQIAPSDAERPLTPDGIEHVERLAQVLNHMAISPDVIYSSPRVRAQQTAEIIANTLGKTIEITEACNFGFNLSEAFALVDGMATDASIMFVGHNPSMSEAVKQASGANVDLNVGAVACVTRIYPNTSHEAVLRWLLNPKTVAALNGITIEDGE